MNISSRDRNLIIGGIAAAIIIGITAFFIGRSTDSGEQEKAETTTPTVATATTVTSKTSTGSQNEEAAQVYTVPPVEASETTPATSQAGQIPVIVSVEGPMQSVPASTAITFRVAVQGPAEQVGIGLKKADAEYGGGPIILAKQNQTGDIAVYMGGLGYFLTPGDYVYFAWAFASNGTQVKGPQKQFTVTQ